MATAAWPSPKTADAAIPAEARLLGYAAMVPLAASAAGLWITDSADGAATAVEIMRSYGAVCMAFLGGVRLGPLFAMPAGTPRRCRIALTVLPPTLGWLALLPGPVAGLGLLVCGFLVQCLWDVLSTQRGRLPAWYARLRVQVTAVATVCLIAGLARLVTAT